MKRGCNVLCALAGALTLLVAVVFGMSRGPTALHASEASIARSRSMPRVLVAVAVRAIHARPATPSSTLECDRRTPVEHGGSNSTACALPPSSFSVDAAAWFEHASSLGRTTTRIARERSAWRRPEARAPPTRNRV